MPGRQFAKPALSVKDQLALLKKRNLQIPNDAEAEHHLEQIGFYRLTGYMLSLQIAGKGPDKHQFKVGTTFDNVIERYSFDRKLRLEVMDAIERIEIAIRSALINSVGVRHGAHWYQNPALFNQGFNHQEYVNDIKRQICHDPAKAKSRNVIIKHYYDEYSSPDMPPCWMIFESISFGTISWTVKTLRYPEYNDICARFGLPHQILSSWLHSLSYVRNLCAHHSRLWNRIFTIKPLIANAYRYEMTPNDKLYAQLVVMQVLLSKIAPGNHWATKLHDLIAAHPATPIKSMGFPDEWEKGALWK